MTLPDKNNFLICEVREKLFALPLAGVERVLRAVEVSALPHGSSALLGVINVQGRTVRVVNTYFHFDLPTRDIEPEDFLILLRVSQQTLALPANRVLEVVSEQTLPAAEAAHDQTNQDSTLHDFISADALALSDDIRIWNSRMVWLVDLTALLQSLRDHSSAHVQANRSQTLVI